MNAFEELRAAADLISAHARHTAAPGSEVALQRLSDAAEAVGQAWCGSWMPGHTHLYRNFLELDAEGTGPCAAWSVEAIHDAIHERAGRPDTQLLLADAMQTAQLFERARCDALALMVVAACEHGADPVLGALLKQASQLRLTKPETLLDNWQATIAMAAGQLPQAAPDDMPPHIAELAAIDVLRSPRAALDALTDLLQRAVEHLALLACDEDLPMAPTWVARPDSAREHMPG